MNGTATKAELRRLIADAIRTRTAGERRLASEEIVRSVLEQPQWAEAGTVLLYLPLSSEPDIRPLFEAAWKSGKRTALLRHDQAADHFQPRLVRDFAADLEKNPAFNVLEPANHCPAWPANQLDLVLVPGVAFTRSGCRLGRGRGYYDRFLSQASGILVGVAFAWQILESIPTEPHDMGVHCMVTPAGWQEVAPGPRV